MTKKVDTLPDPHITKVFTFEFFFCFFFLGDENAGKHTDNRMIKMVISPIINETITFIYLT
jgi:hypothetical protein